MRAVGTEGERVKGTRGDRYHADRMLPSSPPFLFHQIPQSSIRNCASLVNVGALVRNSVSFSSLSLTHSLSHSISTSNLILQMASQSTNEYVHVNFNEL